MTKTMIKKVFSISILLMCNATSSAHVPSNIHEVLKQINLPLQKTEKESDLVMNYYYQDAEKNQLVIGAAEEFIDVSWTFKKSPNENSEINQQAKLVTQKLLGEEWQSLYDGITDGGTIEYLSQDNGIVVIDAMCSETMCGYQVKK